jgi:NADPH-dependent F420 reductase
VTLPASIAIIGGTGKEGRGLGARWSRAGIRIILGSRDGARAAEAAKALSGLSGGKVDGDQNAPAAARADIAVLTTPFDGLDEALPPCAEALAGKLVVSAVNPLVFGPGGVHAITPPEGSAAEHAAALLPASRVGAAFHNVSAPLLLDLEHQLDEDVPVAADGDEDRQTIAELCTLLGVRGVGVGPLSLARYLEGFTAVLLSVNRLHKARAGIRFTGLPQG